MIIKGFWDGHPAVPGYPLSLLIPWGSWDGVDSFPLHKTDTPIWKKFYIFVVMKARERRYLLEKQLLRKLFPQRTTHCKANPRRVKGKVILRYAGRGLYQQIQNGGNVVTYSPSNFSLESFRTTISNAFHGNPETRNNIYLQAGTYRVVPTEPVAIDRGYMYYVSPILMGHAMSAEPIIFDNTII